MLTCRSVRRNKMKKRFWDLGLCDVFLALIQYTVYKNIGKLDIIQIEQQPKCLLCKGLWNRWGEKQTTQTLGEIIYKPLLDKPSN